METYKSKTAKGTAFELERDGERVKLTIQSLGIQGALVGEIATRDYGRVLHTERDQNVGGKKQRVSVPITPEVAAWLDAAKAEAEAAKKAAAAKAEDDIRSGRVLIQLSYSDGEYLSGHTCYDVTAAKLLVGLGLAREVDGWGVHVGHKLVEALGESFSYSAAAAFAAPAMEAKDAAKRKAAEERDAIFAEARRTGERQVLRTWGEDCDGSEPDCSYDALTTWAMPDGTTTTTRIHTF